MRSTDSYWKTGKKYERERLFMSQNDISQEGFQFGTYQRVFYHSRLCFLIFLYPFFDSLIRRLGLNSAFIPLTVSSADRQSNLVTFSCGFLATGCNYLMSVPGYPGLTPPCPVQPLPFPRLHVRWYLPGVSACSCGPFTFFMCVSNSLTD